MREPVKLVTSLAPHNADNQRQAMDSWLRAGFSVMSINSRSETDQLRGQFPGIEFRSVERDASHECGRPLVFLDDVFAFLRTNGSGVCGLINSDIHLRADKTAVRFVVEQAKDSLVLASRIDVESLDNQCGEVFKHGFDVFLFDRIILDVIPPSRFCLGLPWWDYWFPSCVLRARRPIPLKLAAFPFVAHIKHASNWDRDRNFEKYGLHCMQFFEPAKSQELAKLPPEQLRLLIGTYSVQIARAIWGNSRWLSYAGQAA